MRTALWTMLLGLLAVAAPQFQVGSSHGNFASAIAFSQVGSSLTITCPQTGTSIWYTTNGDYPTPADAPYTGAITVTTGEVVRAVCAYTGATNTTTTSLSGSSGWKINCPAGTPQPMNGWTCSSTGGVGTNPLSSFNLTFAGGQATENIQCTATTGDCQLLAINQPNTITCNACTTIDQYVVFTEAPSPAASLENAEFDMQMLIDAFGYTKILGQFSSQCQGSSGDFEINASGSWVKINVPCTLTNINMHLGGHIEANGVGNCTAAVLGSTPTYGCAVFDYIINSATHTFYGPISSYCFTGNTCDTYALIQQPTWSYFAASNQHQQDIYNINTAGGSPSTSTRTITVNNVTSTKGIVGTGSFTAS